MAKKIPTINLLKKNEKSIVDTVLDWALTIGRVVVIITEGIALSAFLYRFTLDRQVIDLHDEISQKQAFVKLLKTNEDAFRNLQERLEVASQLSTTGSGTNQVFIDILSLIPTGFLVNKYLVTTENIKIDGNAQSPATLATLVTGLKTYPAIQYVSIDKIENKTTNATIAVSITATLKKKAP